MHRWMRRFIVRRKWDLIGFIEEFGIIEAECQGKIDPDAPYTYTTLLKVLVILQGSWGGSRHFRPFTLSEDWACTVSPFRGLR